MYELESIPEPPEVTKDQVVAEYRKFIDKGITNPDNLPLNDPELIKANRLYYAWSEQKRITAKKQGTPGADLACNLELDTFLADAGFSDPAYLKEVAHDLLSYDLETAYQQGNTDMIKRIGEKIKEIEAKIPKS